MDQVHDELAHFGVLGLHCGVRKGQSKSVSPKAKAKQEKKAAKQADKDWGKRANTKALTKKSMDKLANDPKFAKDTEAIFTAVQRLARTQEQLQDSFQLSVASHIDSLWAKDKSLYNPSGTRRLSMQAIDTGYGVYMRPNVVKVKSISHAEIDDEEPDEIDLYYRIDSTGKIKSAQVDETTGTLVHYGVLGMHWGVKKSGGKTRVSLGKTKDDKIKDRRRADVKNRRKLTDAQLTAKIGRLEKEKKLRELTDAEINPGKKATKDILSTSAKAALTSASTAVALYGIKKAVEAKFGSGTASAIFPKKK